MAGKGERDLLVSIACENEKNLRMAWKIGGAFL
jgi:hypothetical protein